ncbi:MAG: hypothetical protein A4E38_01941 [Methanoregulaceae archaeon PtaB.Bin108]|nr:MAG: hypothetical protein A4E38_01941 [Methanoregulaceae archaeon PtaB.Bin108]
MYSYVTGISLIDEVKEGIPPGSNVLILAPSMSSGEQLGYALSRPRPGEYALILTTVKRSVELLDYFSHEEFDRNRIGIIDSVTKLSTPDITDNTQIKFVSSPSDLTGIGIKFSSVVESVFNGEFSDAEDALFPPPIRFYIDSLTTLLMYRKLEVLYQFLHVITAKLKKMEAVGIYILNNESFDERTLALMKQLMNVVIEVKAEQHGEFLRVRGVIGVSQEWMPFRIHQGQLELIS